MAFIEVSTCGEMGESVHISVDKIHSVQQKDGYTEITTIVMAVNCSESADEILTRIERAE